MGYSVFSIFGGGGMTPSSYIARIEQAVIVIGGVPFRFIAKIRAECPTRSAEPAGATSLASAGRLQGVR